MITELEENQYFVFGSNIQGRHAGGAAKQAHEQFGAQWGIGAGLTGKCYAIPTMGGMSEMQSYIEQFIEVAELLPQKTFLLTKIGCGIAGYSESEIAPLFKYAPENVIKPEGWDYEITDIEPEIETIEVNGKKYRKSDVEDRLKELKEL